MDKARIEINCSHCGGAGTYSTKGPAPSFPFARGNNGSNQQIRAGHTCGICGGTGRVSTYAATQSAKAAS